MCTTPSNSKLALAILLGACGSDAPGGGPVGPGPHPPHAVCAVHVSDPEAGSELAIETDRQLEASAELCNPGDTPPADTIWSSSNNVIASISDRGVVSGLASGAVRISATIGGVTGSRDLQVDLPPAGQSDYIVAYVGGSIDTVYRNGGRAFMCSGLGIYLNTTGVGDGDLSGFISLGTAGFVPFTAREYPLFSDPAPVEPPAGSATAYTIFNGYSANISGRLTILSVGPDHISGSFDFSAPTEGQSPEFTVRIRGSFLATPDDPTSIC